MRHKRAKLKSLTLIDIATGVAAAAGAVAMTGHSATAQNLAAPSWTGFYIGGHAGYRSASADFSSNPYTVTFLGNTVNLPGFRDSFSPDSFIGGVHYGYNWQLGPNGLIGIENDWSFGSSKDSISQSISGQDLAGDGFTFRRNAQVELTWQTSIRGRFGYVAGPVLWYATTGVAFAHVKWSETSTLNVTSPTGTISSSSSADKTLTGFVIGGGLEYMVQPNWMIRAEYLYENFGSFTVPHGIGGQSGELDLEHIHKIRAGLSYKFGP